MSQESKLDVLLRTIEENEKKRMEAEARTRDDLADLKKMVEICLPKMEEKVEKLSESVQTLSHKVELMEGGAIKQETAADASAQGTPWLHGKRNPPPISPSPFSPDSTVQSPTSSSITPDLSTSLPPMTCPKFDGENPQMWKSNCEQYFDIYGINPMHWVKVATLNFSGNATFWLQSIRSQIMGITWQTLCDLICARFTRDIQEALIRKWFHAQQNSTVTEYVEQFDSIMHQLMAYDSALTPVYFVTKFIEGLRDDVRGAVMLQRPQDLDSACSIALLQEEILESNKSTTHRRSDNHIAFRPVPKLNNYVPVPPGQRSVAVSAHDDKKGVESAKSREDKFASLKSYRRAKGLCFVCGERWGRDHKCATSVQLHVVQELLEAMRSECNSDDILTAKDPIESVEAIDGGLMAISQQALWGYRIIQIY